MSDIPEFKSNFDIVQVALDVGCRTKKISTRYQGDGCPVGHTSDGGKCLVIYPETQSAYCFHCGMSFDVIKLIETAKELSFIPACNWLSDTYGMPRLKTKEMSEEEKTQYEKKIHQQKIILDILTDAANFYHEILMTDKKIKNYLISHYGLNENTIASYRIGYSAGEGLFKHLSEKGHLYKNIIATGLLSKYGNYEFFDKRIIFPYWVSGNVAYCIGRKTERTPDNDYEKSKYKKLPVYSKDKPHISEFINNKYYVGEDSIKGQDTIFVTEGITDNLALLQFEKPCISPVTTRFRKTDFPRLEKLTKNVHTIYLIPDNEESKAGIDGAMDTADELEKIGKSVYIVTIPRPEGQDKIDLNEYLLTHTTDDFDELVKQAKTPLQIEIDNIADTSPTLIQLPDKLSSLKDKFVTMPKAKILTHLEYLKGIFKLKTDFITVFQSELNDHKKSKDIFQSQIEESGDSKLSHTDIKNFASNIKDPSIPIIEGKSRLFRITIREKYGEKYPVYIPITSFTLRPLESITPPGESESLRIILITPCKNFEVLFPPGCWCSTQKFINILPVKETIFTGSSQDVQFIRNFISTFEMPHKVGIRTSGFHDGKFITEEGALSSQGVFMDIKYFNEVDSNCKLLSTEPATTEELAEIVKYISSFNTLAVTIPILGWTTACFFKSVISSILQEIGLNNGFPLLNIQGEAGAGKTITAIRIIYQIWAISDNPKSINDLTKFTMMKLVTSSNTIPIILEENKSCMQTEYFHKIISNLIRSSYNSLKGERGRSDQSMQTYSYQSPIIIVGETGFTEPALLDRFIPIFLSKKDSAPHFKNFQNLIKQPLKKLGRTILEKALRMDKEDIKNILEDELRKVHSDLTDRHRTNAAICRSGLRILEQIFNKEFTWNKSGEFFTGGFYIDQTVKEGLFEDDSLHRKSAVDKILEAMCLMSEYKEEYNNSRTSTEIVYKFQDHLVKGNDYEIDTDILKIFIPGIYPIFKKWAKAYQFEGDLLPEKTFKKQIQSEPYYIHKSTIRIGDQIKWGHKLDIAKMIQKGLELSEKWGNNKQEYPF